MIHFKNKTAERALQAGHTVWRVLVKCLDLMGSQEKKTALVYLLSLTYLCCQVAPQVRLSSYQARLPDAHR